ncbi:MAG: hypothetical protein ACRDTT_19055, partial [Pseudonocardiaceae bacterium]
LWASAPRRVERAVLEGHIGEVTGVCAVRVQDREILASAKQRSHGAVVGPANRPPAPHDPRPLRGARTRELRRWSPGGRLVVGLSAGLLALSVTAWGLRR